MDALYYRSQSAAFLRQYRALQGFHDAARTDTPELTLAVRTAMDAIWALVDACDRKANQEARHEAAEPDYVWDWPTDTPDDLEDRLSASWPRTEADRRYDAALSGCSDPVHDRQRAITRSHADHSGSRLFIPSPLDSLFG